MSRAYSSQVEGVSHRFDRTEVRPYNITRAYGSKR
jgi:hypothetical protein